MTIPQHIMHDGQQLNRLDRIEGESVWYIDAFCWGGPGCDEVQSILPQGESTWEYPEFVPYIPVPTPEIPGAAIPEPHTAGLMALAFITTAAWRKWA